MLAFNLNEWHIQTSPLPEPSCLLIDFRCFSQPNNFFLLFGSELNVSEICVDEATMTIEGVFPIQLENKLTEKLLEWGGLTTEQSNCKRRYFISICRGEPS